jgi:PAS domain-containing protein
LAYFFFPAEHLPLVNGWELLPDEFISVVDNRHSSDEDWHCSGIWGSCLAKGAEAGSKLREMAMDSCINALLITDEQGRIKYVNAQFCKLWGYDAGEVVSGGVFDICRIAEAPWVIEDSLREEGRWIGEMAALKKGRHQLLHTPLGQQHPGSLRQIHLCHARLYGYHRA